MKQLDFNLAAGIADREEGLALAATNRSELLAIGRTLVKRAALRNYSREATADDAALGLSNMGFPANVLGNAAGSLFRGKEWEFTGQWRPSRRVSNHAHQNRVWRLV